MDALQTTLAPLTDWMPAGVRDLAPIWVWWLVFLIAALVALLVVFSVLKSIGRALFGGGSRVRDWDRELREELDECPLPPKPRSDQALWVYHLPARLRLIIVAPSGKEHDVDATAVEKLLDRVIPGLGTMAAQDKPRIRVWPPQLSHQGFAAAFHRRTHKFEAEGQPSRWVLVAGRAQAGHQQVLLGLGLWTPEPNTLGRVNLEPRQWLDVLRLRT
jgi:hypothetical protein